MMPSLLLKLKSNIKHYSKTDNLKLSHVVVKRSDIVVIEHFIKIAHKLTGVAPVAMLRFPDRAPA